MRLSSYGNAAKIKSMAKDWNFKFDQYTDGEEVDLEEQGVKHYEAPRISGYKSRFSNGEAMMQKLAELELEVSKHAIVVGARTQDINDLWKFYSVLSEYWDNIRHTFGSYVNDDMNNIKRVCRLLMEKFASGSIPPKVHNNLLYFKSQIYRMAQYKNFRFETERVRRGVVSRAVRKITQ